MTERNDKGANFLWLKVVACITTTGMLLTTGWAASATTSSYFFGRDAARIEVEADKKIKNLDERGTVKALELDRRMTSLEATIPLKLNQVQETLVRIEKSVADHVAAQNRPGPSSP
jgi:hypothetical protein